MEREILRAIVFLVGLGCSCVTAMAVTEWVRKIACARGWYDKPDARKVHRDPIPRLGGIGIVSGFFVGLSVFYAIGANFEATQAFISFPAPNVLLAALIMALCGFVDDTAGYRPFQKFFCQICVTLMVILEGYRFDLGFLGESLFGIPISPIEYVLSFFWILGIINAVNLIDGLDGLAAGTSLITVSALTIAVAVSGRGPDLVFAGAFVGALFGFLVLNFHPARIFMGDTGSLFLGFMVAIYSLSLPETNSFSIALLAPIVALGLPVLDTLTAFTRRALQGQSPFAPDKEHIHHRISRFLGLSHRSTVLTLYLIAAAFGITSILLSIAQFATTALALAATAGMILFILLRLEYLKMPGDIDLAVSALWNALSKGENTAPKLSDRFKKSLEQLKAQRRERQST